MQESEIDLHLKRHAGRPRSTTLQQRLRARTLYFAGITREKIAEACGLENADTVRNLVMREGWAALKLAQDPESQAIIAEAKRRAKECLQEWIQEISMGSQELSLAGIGLARDKGDRGDARGFKDAASAVKTFVDIARQAEGLGNDAAASNTVNVSMFFLSSLAEPEPVNVTPQRPAFRIAAVADVSADPIQEPEEF